MFFEIGAHPDEKSKSIIAFVAFRVHSDWIKKSSKARHLRDLIIVDLEKDMGQNISKNKTGIGDLVSERVNDLVEDLAKSKVAISWDFLKRISSFYKVMIAITLGLLLLVFVAYFYTYNIGTESFITLTIGLIIGLFIEIGIPLRKDIARNKQENMEWE